MKRIFFVIWLVFWLFEFVAAVLFFVLGENNVSEYVPNIMFMLVIFAVSYFCIKATP